jgi:hypothetical protein
MAMNLRLVSLRFASIAIGIFVPIFAVGTGFGHACAESIFDARYSISMAGIPIGKSAWTIAIAANHYTLSADGVASGLMSLLVRGRGTAMTQGAVKDSRLVPEKFTIKGVEDGQDTDVQMTLNNGIITELLVSAAPDSADRIPITAAHLRGVLDPLSAFFIEGHGSRNIGAECNRTLPIFDGQRRYDVGLWFKRLDSVRAEIGFEGSALVCGMMLQPIAGHRTNSAIIKYVAGKRDIEAWFAPVMGTNLMAPFRIEIPTMLGTMVVQSTWFGTRPGER